MILEDGRLVDPDGLRRSSYECVGNVWDMIAHLVIQRGGHPRVRMTQGDRLGDLDGPRHS